MKRCESNQSLFLEKEGSLQRKKNYRCVFSCQSELKFVLKKKMIVIVSGPLHISPVDRAGSVSEISPRYSNFSNADKNAHFNRMYLV